MKLSPVYCRDELNNVYAFLKHHIADGINTSICQVKFLPEDNYKKARDF